MANFNVTDPAGATDADDLILGSALGEEIFALDGNDLIAADAGDDKVSGGAGEDTLLGEDGNDVLVGDTGNDTMLGGNGNDRMIWNNGDGSDVMEGGEGKDTAEANGSDGAGDVFEIGAGEDGRVDFARTNFGPFTLDIGSTEWLVVNGLGGDDVISGGEGLADLIKLKLYGGEGNDHITGGDGDDLLKGDDGDDVLVGFRGNDRMIGGNGNDRMIWNNGDGSDVMEGGEGFDTAEANGSDTAGDVFEIGAGEDGRVDFARTNFGQFTLDIGSTERLVVNGQGGDDVITGGEGLSELIELKLYGGDGNDKITGGDGDDLLKGGNGNDVLVGFRGNDTMLGGYGRDKMIWNNGDGSDIMDGGKGHDIVQVNGSTSAGDVFEINADGDNVNFARTNFGNFTLDISNSEVLVVRGLGGDDVITGSEGLQGLIDLRLFVGAGNDQITGGDGNDRLLGGKGHDLLVGAKGADTMKGGFGRDTMVWNNGDGSDVMDGGKGIDTVIVNGSDSAGDVFNIQGDGRDIDFNRSNFGPFTLDISKTEKMEVNGGGGDDVITAQENLWTGITLRLNGGDGNDDLTGGNTNDYLNGGADDDRLDGGSGNDQLTGGAGEDVFVFSFGQDTVTDFEQGEDIVVIDAGFGIGAGDIVDHLSQVGDDVVLTIGDDSMTFLDQTLGHFSNDDFGFLS